LGKESVNLKIEYSIQWSTTCG